MRACELDELGVAGVYGAEGSGAHDKARAVDEELFGAGYGFIPDRLEGVLGHAFRRQVARELAVDVPFVQNARNAELVEFARSHGIEVVRACEGASEDSQLEWEG